MSGSADEKTTFIPNKLAVAVSLSTKKASTSVPVSNTTLTLPS